MMIMMIILLPLFNPEEEKLLSMIIMMMMTRPLFNPPKEQLPMVGTQTAASTAPSPVIIIINIIIIIIITRPKPAYCRQGLAGSWGQDRDEVSTFLVFLTSHFAPAALSSELNQPGTIHDDTNPPGIMKTRPGAITKT